MVKEKRTRRVLSAEVPEKLYKQVREAADVNHRSTSKQLIVILELYFELQEREHVR
jgi:hypothetical protein